MVSSSFLVLQPSKERSIADHLIFSYIYRPWLTTWCAIWTPCKELLPSSRSTCFGTQSLRIIARSVIPCPRFNHAVIVEQEKDQHKSPKFFLNAMAMFATEALRITAWISKHFDLAGATEETKAYHLSLNILIDLTDQSSHLYKL